jgi:hypothetical protein
MELRSQALRLILQFYHVEKAWVTGRTKVQELSRRIPTAAARVQSQFRSRELHGE